MGILGTLFGKKKQVGPNASGIFALVTAQVNLVDQYRLLSTGKVGLCFNPMDSSFFTNLEDEIRGLLEVGEHTAGTRYTIVDDDYGFRWVILQDDEFEDLATAAYLAAQTFADHGFAGRLLAVVFPFEYEGREIQWIYNYRRGNFYPFIPLQGRQQRDNALELSLSSKLERELPVEKDLDRWYALWGAPFDAL